MTDISRKTHQFFHITYTNKATTSMKNSLIYFISLHLPTSTRLVLVPIYKLKHILFSINFEFKGYFYMNCFVWKRIMSQKNMDKEHENPKNRLRLQISTEKRSVLVTGEYLSWTWVSFLFESFFVLEFFISHIKQVKIVIKTNDDWWQLDFFSFLGFASANFV